MAYKGWVKKLPSSRTAAHSALFSHPKTNNQNDGCFITSLQRHHSSCHQKPTSHTVATVSLPILVLLYKTGHCQKNWENWLWSDVFTVIYHSSFLWIPCCHLTFNLFWHISLHRSIFDLPLTLVPCVALSNRALWKTVIIGLVLHLTWHHAFISQLIVKKRWVKNIVKKSNHIKNSLFFL